MRNPYKTPRKAHCVGCGVTFNKMHHMINHRRNNRCGGRFLPADERELRDAAKFHYQHFQTCGLPDDLSYNYAQYRDMADRANKLRRRRLDELQSQAS